MKIALLLITSLISASGMCQNLLANASFEANNGGVGQNLMPMNWVSLGSTPDTYTNNGSFGLAPNAFGNFTGVVAQDGIAWVAGWSAGPESFGQVLTVPLVAGNLYELSGWLHQSVRPDLNNPGGYQIRLVTSTSDEVLGVLGSTSSTSEGWVSRSFSFVAPSVTGTQTLKFVPIRTATGGAYPGLDNVNLQAVPEPTTMLVLGLGLSAAIRRNRKSN